MQNLRKNLILLENERTINFNYNHTFNQLYNWSNRNIFILQVKKKRTLNEYRQTKDSHYINRDTPIEYSINFLCRLYPNDADLGAIVRKHFQKI